MSIQKLEAELEATRQKIAEQLSMVGRSIQSIDPTLHEKERELEQAVIDAHLDEEPDTTDWKQELRDFINDKSKKYDMPRDKHGYVNLMAQLAANNEIDAFIERKILEEPDDEG